VDIHCQRIIFCASADNGYARLLGPHRGSNFISLVEGPPFAKEMKELSHLFATTSFPEIFRSQKLAKRVSISGTKPTPHGAPLSNYASAAKKLARPQSSSDELLSTPVAVDSVPSLNSPKLILSKNKMGQRVDSPLHFSTKGRVEALKHAKFCNHFHILGSCPYGQNCTHKHGSRLSDGEVVDLMYIARASPCPRGLRCDDEICINGHRCNRENCTDAAYKGCRFPIDMHGVDLST
jgi:hypothetical protein